MLLVPKYTFNGKGLSIRPEKVWEDDVALRDSEYRKIPGMMLRNTSTASHSF